MNLPRPKPVITRSILKSQKINQRTTCRLYEWTGGFYTVCIHDPVTGEEEKESYHKRSFPEAYRNWKTRIESRLPKASSSH